MSERQERFYDVVDGRVYVTTMLGVKVECLPYADMLMRAGMLLQEPEEPSPPTFMRKDADGNEYPQPYTQEEIDANSEIPQADLDAWAEYKAQHADYLTQKQRVESERLQKRMAVLALKATRLVTPVDLDAWAEEQRDLFGIQVPDDPRQRRIAHFATEVAISETDGARLMAGVLRASGLDEEVLDSVEAMFRDQMEWQDTAGNGAEADQPEG